jgi:hypothetical protein
LVKAIPRTDTVPDQDTPRDAWPISDHEECVRSRYLPSRSGDRGFDFFLLGEPRTARPARVVGARMCSKPATSSCSASAACCTRGRVRWRQPQENCPGEGDKDGNRRPRIPRSRACAREQNRVPAPTPATRHGRHPVLTPAIRGHVLPAGMPACPSDLQVGGAEDDGGGRARRTDGS